MRPAVAIQARMSSSRLPGKVMMDLCGEPMIRRVYDACEASAWDRYILTSNDDSDSCLAIYLSLHQIPYRRGSLENVLSRYVALVDEVRPSVLVRVCGDAPFIKRRWIFSAVEDVETYDRPVFVPGLLHAGSAEHWEECSAEAGDDPENQEHAGAYWFRENGHALHLVPEDYLMVNTQEDLEEARKRWPLIRG